MQLFIDTGDVDEIRKVYNWGILDGITTNPSLVAKTGRKFPEVVKEIVAFFPGVLNLEVIATDRKDMMKQAQSLVGLGKNIVVKLPTTTEGVAACKQLTNDGIRCNLTLCFSVTQALLAAKAGAYYISPFIGRLDDIGENGTTLVAEILEVYDNYGFETSVLAASIRSIEHVKTVALLGAHIATIPYTIIEAMYHHELTDKGLEKFLSDWQASGQKSLI